MIQPLPAFIVDDSHPDAPLYDWLLVLLNAARVPEDSDLNIRPIDIHFALAPSRPSAKLADPALIAARIGLSPLCLASLLSRVFDRFEIGRAFPDFDWRAALLNAFPCDLADYNFPWRLREELRFVLEIYKPVPWSDRLPPIADHYAHLAITDSRLVAYTQDDRKGRADIQTPIKPGRYLTQFYPQLSPLEVRDLQAAIVKPAMLRFAVTADEIEAVYTNGPASCMSHEPSHYESDEHPVRVYGDSDLRLAYVADANGHATARALIWPAKKTYVRIYGNEQLLQPLLETEGYRRGSFHGARIRRIDHGGHSVVMPYIDDDQCFDTVDEQWLKIGGDYKAAGQNGLASLSDDYCASCDARFDSDDLFLVGDELWCECCRDDYSFTSDYSDERFPDTLQAEVVVARKNGELIFHTWTEYERDEHATRCAGSDHYFANENFTFVTLRDDDIWESVTFAEKGDPKTLADPPSASDNANDATPAAAAEDREAA